MTQEAPPVVAAPSDVTPDLGLWLRIVRAVGWTLIWLGMLTLGFVAHQLWITSFFAERQQSQLAEQRIENFAETDIVEIPYIPVVGSGEDDGELVSGAVGGERLTILSEGKPAEGDPFALIRIPKLEELREGWNVVEGVTLADLRTGAGHMPQTPLPGQPGNAVISGHRTTYGAPFHNLDLLQPGDRIEVETALGVHVYQVRESFVVNPTDVWVTEPKSGAWLTLTTCHPKFSARERLIISAQLIEGPNAAVILGTQ
ncbi:MAG: class E sortase [Acidimicrobiia bacterium]|nr:class E sortase [Acidimicrobiia bacterium]